MPHDLSSFRPDQAEDAIRTIHGFFEQHSQQVTALAVLAAGARIQTPQRKAHSKTVERGLVGLVQHLEPKDARAVVTLIRSIVGSHMWSHLRNDHGLESEQTTRAVAWAVSTLIDALREGKAPRLDNDEQKTKASRGVRR
jgi:hypothetical protein